MLNKYCIWLGYKDLHHIGDSFRGQDLVTASSAVILSSSWTPPSQFYNSLNIWRSRFLCFQQNTQYIAHACGGLKKTWTRAVELAVAGKPVPPLPPPSSPPPPFSPPPLFSPPLSEQPPPELRDQRFCRGCISPGCHCCVGQGPLHAAARLLHLSLFK